MIKNGYTSQDINIKAHELYIYFLSLWISCKARKRVH